MSVCVVSCDELFPAFALCVLETGICDTVGYKVGKIKIQSP